MRMFDERGLTTVNMFSFARMPRVPTLTSPSSRDHAIYKGKYDHELQLLNSIRLDLGTRPESFQDFCVESHRLTPTPIGIHRQSLSAKGR